MVSEIQKNANKANASMQSSVANMDSLETETVLVEELLNNITNQVHMVNGQISQIATAAEQQNATSGEISNNIQKISTATSSLNGLVNSVRTDVELAVEKIDHLNRSLALFYFYIQIQKLYDTKHLPQKQSLPKIQARIRQKKAF